VSTHDTDRDYPVVDRVRDDDERGREDDVFDPRDEDDDDGPAHRADSPVDDVPGESDPAGPGDPLPGEGLGASGTRDDTGGDLDQDDEDGDRREPVVVGETTVVAVDDVASQDPGVVTVPPATDDDLARDRSDGRDRTGDTFDDTSDDTSRDTVGDATADEMSGPPVEALPVPVPGDSGESRESADDTGTGGSEDFEAAWRDLQVTFVDDPAAAVRGAAELLERAVAEMRQDLEGSDSTEDLRTAFRRYRDVFRTLH